MQNTQESSYNTPIDSTEVKTPHVSYIAYPVGAWLAAIAAAGIFALTSQHPERMNIMQILIAASMAAATIGGTLYVLSLLALKRYPSFKLSFFLGLLVATGCIAGAVVLHQPKLSLVLGCVFLLVSAMIPFFLRKRAV